MSNGNELITVGQLRSFVERVERLNEERKALSQDISEVYGEAKATGYDVKALKALIREREQEPEKLKEFSTILDLYRNALRGSGAIRASDTESTNVTLDQTDEISHARAGAHENSFDSAGEENLERAA